MHDIQYNALRNYYLFIYLHWYIPGLELPREAWGDTNTCINGKLIEYKLQENSRTIEETLSERSPGKS